MEHIHAGALTALLALQAHRSKSEVAAAIGITPANLREYETGLRTGSTLKTRKRIARELNVLVPQITCWCDRPAVKRGRKTVRLCRSVVA